MALNPVELGFEYFPDPTKGSPVYFGSIYVGEPDLDPQIPANQKTIQYRQEDGTLVPATQPVATSAGGVPLYNGSPVQIIVDGTYSIKVLNSSGSQVYYRADSSDNESDAIVPLDVISDLQANTDDSIDRVSLAGHTTEGDDGGDGFWLDTVDTTTADDNGVNIVDSVSPRIGTWKRLSSGVVYLGWFGVIGDGIADDTVAVQAAFNFAAATGKTLICVPGTYRCTAPIIVKTGTWYFGNHATIFVQDYEYIVSPKNESLFVNESYDDNASLDTDIHLDGLSIKNGASITTGSFVSINRCENYTITNFYAVKTSANGTMNINGKGVTLDKIYINSLSPGGLNSDGIHFEYLEDATLSNLNIKSQDDCLGFAYFPIIAGNPNNGPAGRDKPSRNITISNAILSSDIANGIRIGNTTLLGVAVDDLISTEARYEWMTFNNVVFNKVGVSGACIEMYDIRTNADFPSSEIRFNNMVLNDSTSSTRSMVRIVGNSYLSAENTYAAQGATRNYGRIFFNGISGRHSTSGQTINAGAVKRLSLVDYQIERTAQADNEVITTLVDDVVIKASTLKSQALSGTSNTLFCIDFDTIRIDGTELTGSGTENAALQISRPEKGNGGEILITGSQMSGQVTGVKAVSAIVLDKIQIDADFEGLTGTLRNSNLQATYDDIGAMTGLNANISVVVLNEARRTNNLGVLNFVFTTNGTISSGQVLATFPLGVTPANTSAVRAFMSNSSGTAIQVDYSSGAGLRTQASTPAETYYLTIAYTVGV